MCTARGVGEILIDHAEDDGRVRNVGVVVTGALDQKSVPIEPFERHLPADLVDGERPMARIDRPFPYQLVPVLRVKVLRSRLHSASIIEPVRSASRSSDLPLDANSSPTPER
jgi:hypothetical protein